MTEHRAERRTPRAKRLLAEPTLHFFVAGALLFLAHRWIAGDPRTIVVTPGVEADIARRFRDHSARSPTPAELESALAAWKRDEALYREALRDGLDRDDAVVRQVLIDKVRARLALELPKREPSDAELQRFLEANRSAYEIPLRYDYEFVAFPRAERNAEAQRETFERALKEGAAPATLGRPIVGGNQTMEDLRRTLGEGLADRVAALPVGQWQRLERDESLLLVRLKAISGGLPSVDDVRPLLIGDYARATLQEEVERAAQSIADRYRFEERR